MPGGPEQDPIERLMGDVNRQFAAEEADRQHNQWQIQHPEVDLTAPLDPERQEHVDRLEAEMVTYFRLNMVHWSEQIHAQLDDNNTDQEV